VSSTSVDTALQTRLLRPRQLRELVLQPDATPRGPIARGYSDADGDGKPEPVGGDPNYLPTQVDATVAWTAGGLAATSRGLARATHAIFRERLLTAASLDQMTHFVDAPRPTA
jgi:CubicO group peptidase (beta-lactamase class C family)